ncbi:hypothetical protein ABZ714_26580 [Streptomyces sp. NPDC006798]|uniref:hypothetical protein n=1 Tax=Streptomyces sp. NPDC006798 TaxID=3155462 RepID=UPI0033D8E0A9
MMTRPAYSAALDDSPRCGVCHRIHCHCARPWARRTASASVVEEIEREEERRWLEPHDDEFHQLVAYLVADGDRRALALGRRAARACPSCGGSGGRTEDTSDGGVVRRTWRSCSACGGTGQGYAPAALVHQPKAAGTANDRCPVCEFWSCICVPWPGTAPSDAPFPAVAPTGASGQCSRCGQWFDDWTGGVCDGCR